MNNKARTWHNLSNGQEALASLISSGYHKLDMCSQPTNKLLERPLLQPVAQAEVFAVVRQAHQMESTEDYVELIDDLIRSQGEARLVEVAERLGISQPSASKTLARLQREGFVTSEPYRSLFLTDKGKKLADSCRERHDLVYQFLLCIGVSEGTANIDSEGMEHHVSAETLAAFRQIINQRQPANNCTDT